MKVIFLYIKEMIDSICEFDIQLNFIRNIEVPVFKNDFDIPFNRLSEYREMTDYIDDLFSDY